jgi:NAD(P)-dependent dehydrogenase (short-subunit alcohol dehydrogenase family)
MAGILIVGAGPGIATSVARRFGGEGMPVGLIARSQESIDTVSSALEAAGVASVVGATGDAADEGKLTAALDAIVAANGIPEVVVYNAGVIRFDKPGELSYAEHQETYAINVLGALATAAHLAPRMGEAGGGTIVFTGGMPQPVSALISLSLGKVALRALTEMLADEYGPAGVHVATVTVCDAVAPGGPYDPDLIAEHYLRLHRQPRPEWEHEVVFAGEEAART